MNLAQVLQTRFKVYAARQAFVFDEKRVTYEQLDTTINKVSELLKRKGVKKGDRVAIQLSKCLEAVYLHLACTAIGAIALPLNDGYKSAELEYFVENSGSSLFVTDSACYLKAKETLNKMGDLKIMTLDQRFPETSYYPEEMGNIVSFHEPEYSTNGDDTAMICYTSGKTGRPKGAMITHQNLVEGMEDLHEVWRLSEDDIFLHALPLFHAHGLMLTLHPVLYAGSTTIFQSRFDPGFVWKTIEGKGCTVFSGVPTMYQRLVNEWEQLSRKPDISSMRVFITGSAQLPDYLSDQFNDATGFRILERYGMTETLVIATNPYEAEKRKAKSVGFPLPRVAVRIVGHDAKDVIPGEVGEVCVKGGNVLKGYWQDPAKTKESFLGEWFRTGDLGYQDPNDNMRLYLVSRLKEVVISGGYNVYPKEVETCLEKHKAVREAAVFGLPDLDFGEKVTAAVVLKDNQEASEKNLQAFCKIELANYKCPKKIHFLEKLPRNRMGKLMRGEARKLFL